MGPSAIEQVTLRMIYRDQYLRGCPAPKFSEVGFRAFSQHEEDGILHFIFSIIGTTRKLAVEICAGDGIECNTANLILNDKWSAMLVDGDAKKVNIAKAFYSGHPDSMFWPPTICHEWITKNNINRLIDDNGFAGEIDLLSLDLDGVDYWIWDAITSASPRVVVLEFNHLWGAVSAVTVPYRDDFVCNWTEYGSDYAGASLAAFVKLSKAKGYRLVGTNSIATNAFFVRNDIKCGWLPEVAPDSCFGHPRAQFGMNQRLPHVRGKDWVQV